MGIIYGILVTIAVIAALVVACRNPENYDSRSKERDRDSIIDDLLDI